MRPLSLFVVLTVAMYLMSCRPAKYNSKSASYAPTVEIQTDSGNIEIQLYANTPKHRDNFIKLTKQKYFDGLLFHRVIKGFMIQGGDPDSRTAKDGQALGVGGPGYTIPAEFNDEYIHTKGSLCAARMGDQMNPKKESSGSQFYIVQGSGVTDALLDQIQTFRNFTYSEAQRQAYKSLGGTPHLDREYTVFGNVTKGLDVVEKIAAMPTDAANRPLQNIKMKVRIKKG